MCFQFGHSIVGDEILSGDSGANVACVETLLGHFENFSIVGVRFLEIYACPKIWRITAGRDRGNIVLGSMRRGSRVCAVILLPARALKEDQHGH
jgi:hypothetical protein